jgi:hypothetical protein
MTTPFKAIKCPRHGGVIVARIEVEPDGEKAVIFSTRTLVDPKHVLGGRAAEPENETRLRLDDELIRRGMLPFVVTWCPRCSREYELPMDWLLDEANHSGTAVAPTAVLDS